MEMLPKDTKQPHTNHDHQEIPLNINIDLVTSLIDQQFPQWSGLPITPVIPQGWDNRTFRLGDALLVRLPSQACYANQVAKEQSLLPLFAPHLTPVQVPCPVVQGNPTPSYPWAWSIYRWIPGAALSSSTVDQTQLARDLANFIKKLQSLPTSQGPLPSKDNFFRGGDLSVCSNEAIDALKKLDHIIDTSKAIDIMNRATSTTWSKPPVWVHGDINVGNLLCKQRRLHAVIDFGLVSVGDPACDYVMAWNYFNEATRQCFRDILSIDDSTWLRSAGWELWKSAITLTNTDQITTTNQQQRMQCIQTILDVC